VRPLNFPQLEELAAYVHAGEHCDEQGLSVVLAPEPPTGVQGGAVAQGAAGQQPPKLSNQKPGKSGFFGVTKKANNKATRWWATVIVSRDTDYIVGSFATKEEAARAYDTEVRRRGLAHIKRLNFPDRAAGGAVLPPSSAAAGAHGPV